MATRGKNATIAIALTAIAVGMGGVAYAAVPLYRLFCQVTGFGGTPKITEVLPEAAGERTVTVRFNADVDSRLPWHFTPGRREIEVRVGTPAITVFRARNLADETMTGTASFNVTPAKAGNYFNKVECFCFTKQTLGPGESVEMPVSFYVDPAIADDLAVRDVHTITLSYTFFQSRPSAGSGSRGGSSGSLASVSTD